MNESNFEGEHIKLTCDVGPDQIIYTTVGGKITNENLPIFAAWANRVKQLIEAASKTQEIVLVYSDISTVVHFEHKLIAPLRELFEYDKKYAMKSAIVGASFFMKKLVDAVVDFTGRTNVRQFSSKDDALAWLLEGQSAGESEKTTS